MPCGDISREKILVGMGTFSIDSVSVGATMGGVEVEKTTDFYDKEVDQVNDAVDSVPIKNTLIVRTQFAEADLANLKKVWMEKNAVVEAGGIRTLYIGISDAVIEHNVTFTGAGEDGVIRTYNYFRGRINGASAHGLKKDDKVVFPVEFRILPDCTKAPGKEYGTITEPIV